MPKGVDIYQKRSRGLSGSALYKNYHFVVKTRQKARAGDENEDCQAGTQRGEEKEY